MLATILTLMASLPVFPDVIDNPVERSTRALLTPLFWVLAAILITLIILRRKLNDK